MISNITIFSFFSTLCIFSSIMLVFSNNPLHSALFLILSFFNVSCLLFFLELEYLPIFFLIVYVGAIAVLFIFVIMMLNIRLSELWESSIQLLPCVGLLGICFFLQILFALQTHFSTFSFSDVHLVVEFSESFTTVCSPLSTYQTHPNTKSLGSLLFTEFYAYFIVSGFVLLLSMVGAIVLTLQKTFSGKSQYISKQVMQDFEASITLK